MQRRLVIVAIVFVVGFGLGYGATWLLVGPPGAVKPEANVAAVADAPATVAGTPAPVAGTPAPVAGTPAPAAPVVETADAGVAAPAPDVSAEAPEVAPASPVVAVPANPAVAETPPSQPAAPGETPAPASGGCVGKTCRLDFGGVSGGISVRRGRLDDGQEIDWERDFGPADKLGLIPAGPKVRVEVKAIGRTNGEPSAAWVVFRNRGTSLNGVISLKVGEKKLQLVEL